MTLTHFDQIFSILTGAPHGTRQPMPKFFEVANALVADRKLNQKIPSRTQDQWHLDMAHLSINKLFRLQELGLIHIKNQDRNFKCQSCDAAKLKRKPFAKSMPPKAMHVGESISSDVCGKISPKTIFGEEYFVTFIDEKSGYIHVSPMKKKSEVLDLFKQFRARFNNQNLTTSVKILVSDGGGEYISAEFDVFLKENGIDHAKTPPNTPERNGLSERLNKILMDLVRAMLKHRHMPLRYWGLAVQYAAYIINRTPKNSNEMSRLEMVFGRKPSFKKILEFGIPVMYHNHDPHIKKLHDRAFEGMFVGFWEEDHTYKILDIATNSLISTRTISSYPDRALDFENNDHGEKFHVEDDDNWQSGLTDSPQYAQFDRYQLINNDNLNNNNKNIISIVVNLLFKIIINWNIIIDNFIIDIIIIIINIKIIIIILKKLLNILP